MSEQLPTSSHEPRQDPSDGLSARALLLSMRRHLGLVLCLSLLLSAAGAVIGLGLPRWFQANAVLVIHARPQRISDVQELPDPVPDFAVMRSEADVLQSRSVIEPVVRSLALWRLPEFRERDYPGGWSWDNLKAHILEFWNSAGSENADAGQAPLPSPQPDHSQVTQAQIDEDVEKYARDLLVDTDGHSMTIRVSYRAWAPERAAAIANAHVQSYQSLQEQAKFAAAHRANAALTAQITELRKQLQTAEAAVTRYREEHRLMGVAKDGANLSAQLASLNSQLITAQAELAENEARAARIGGSLGAKGGAESVPEIIANGTIQALRSQEAQLVAREADLSKDHGEAYPELRRVRASLKDLREQIAREIARGHSAALQLVERSRIREKSIQQSVSELTKKVNSADAGLQQLQANADSIRAVLRDFEKRAEETATNPALVTSNSSLVSRANPSAASTSSKTRVLAFAGGFAGLTLSGLLSVFLELRDRTFRTTTEVEQQIGSVRIVTTPRAARRRRTPPADIILNETGSLFAEAFRLSWANIELAIESPRDSAVGTRRSGIALGITSAVTGEGKSTHALAFARTAALAGERVVLVDADLRRAGVTRLLHQRFRFTLEDFLRDQCAADELVAVEERSGAYFVPSSPVAAVWTSQDLRRFFELILYLKQRFAIVIIDLPPILGIAETIRLSLAADSMVLIIRWGRTERQLVQFAQYTLHNAGLVASAVILNDIDIRAQQRRGYRDRTIVYTNEDLYRTPRKNRQSGFEAALQAAADRADRPPQTDEAEPQPSKGDHDRARAKTEVVAPAETTARSDIERLYQRYHGS